MITLKDLQHKEILNNETIKFDYRLEFETDSKGKTHIWFQFRKILNSESNEWKLFVRLLPSQEKESQVYEFNYALPKQNVSLVLIASTGLRLFQMVLQEEMQNKHLIDFEISNLIQASIGNEWGEF